MPLQMMRILCDQETKPSSGYRLRHIPTAFPLRFQRAIMMSTLRSLVSVSLTSLLALPCWVSGCDERDTVTITTNPVSPDPGAPDPGAPNAMVPDAAASDAAVPDAAVSDATVPDGAALPPFPCAGVLGDASVEGGASGLPACMGPFAQMTSADCTAAGFRLHVATLTCVDECVAPEQITDTGDCCTFDADGFCCPSGQLDVDGACFPTGPGTGSGSGANPCPANRPYLKCSGIGSCHCSSNP
jgi:hypothetical protein